MFYDNTKTNYYVIQELLWTLRQKHAAHLHNVYSKLCTNVQMFKCVYYDWTSDNIDVFIPKFFVYFRGEIYV